MIKLRHQQPSLCHKGLAKDIEDLWEPWMREVDQLLEDAALVEEVYEAQGKRHFKSQTRGRTQTAAEVVLRLLSRSTKSSERRELQRMRWFRCGQRWRTGCEGRISVLKRRHGLSRCRYRGFEGMQRWVGLGVIADNIIQIGSCLART